MASSGASGGGVYVSVTGLAELRRSLKKLAPDVDKELRAGLKKAGDIVRDQARHNATVLYRRRTGNLVGGIRTSVSVNAITVRSQAKHRGFAYSVWLEEEKKPYMVPALEYRIKQVEKQIQNAVAHALRDANL